jgi:hypothetical protein
VTVRVKRGGGGGVGRGDGGDVAHPPVWSMAGQCRKAVLGWGVRNRIWRWPKTRMVGACRFRGQCVI